MASHTYDLLLLLRHIHDCFLAVWHDWSRSRDRVMWSYLETYKVCGLSNQIPVVLLCCFCCEYAAFMHQIDYAHAMYASL